MKYKKIVRGFALQVVKAPKTFALLLELAKVFNSRPDEKLEEALCASAHNNELQHPAAERFAYGQAEYVCEVYKLGDIREVLKTDKRFDDASKIVKWAKAKAIEAGAPADKAEWNKLMAKGEIPGFWSQEQAQEYWDTKVCIYSGIGKEKKTSSDKLSEAVWLDRKNTVAGLIDSGLSGEQILASVGAGWGQAETQALLEKMGHLEPVE